MIRAILAAATLVLALVVPAAAVQPAGTAAWTIWDATIYDGPGKTYDELGTVPGAIKIRVDRCSGYWCQFRGGGKNGWIALVDISFGTGPDAPLSGPRLDYPPAVPMSASIPAPATPAHRSACRRATSPATPSFRARTMSFPRSCLWREPKSASAATATSNPGAS